MSLLRKPEQPTLASPEMSWWAVPGEDAIAVLDSSERGLSSQEAGERLERWGRNALESRSVHRWQRLLIDQFASPLIYILLAAAIVSLAIQEWLDAGFILAVVLLNAVVGFFQEYRAERSMEALRRLTVARAHVLRDGREEVIDAELLVPGDIVLVEGGNRVPADCRLLYAAALETDESLLTGESTTVAKGTAELDETTPLADRRNMLSMGTNVARGRGRALVVAIGRATQLGLVAGLVEEIGRAEVPLVARMSRFARLISYVILGGSTLGFLGGLAAGQPADELFLTLVALAVSAIPEGLPIVLTVTLAVGLTRMAKRNVIIRRLAAVEALGSCTVIGSDKTGTLTQNRMMVSEVYAGGRYYEISGTGYEADGVISEDGMAVGAEIPEALQQTLQAGVLCNDAGLAAEADGAISVTGDPTEIALLVAAAKAGIWKAEVEVDFPRWAEMPFDPERRIEVTMHATDGSNLVIVKGAPEEVVPLCSDWAADGEYDPQAVLDAAHQMAVRGLRVLAMASRETEAVSLEDFGVESDLRLLGLQGMIDPPREEVPVSIRGCREAGIRVLMLTGDHASTGLAVGRRLGIAGPEDRAITGSELDATSDESLLEIVREVPVFARVSPDHKYRIVQALQANGEVVAVTGDGVNDGPALKAANIGVAMGRSGTDVAKEASDVVITDDNFASIFAGIQEGRVVFDNVRMVTFFLISCGVGEFLSVVASILFGFELPLRPAQLLWLNLVTNGVEDVSLALEPGEPDVTRRPPRPPDEGVLSRDLWERTILTGLTLAAGTLLLFLLELDSDATLERAQTVALSTLVLFQVFHVGNCRSERRSALAKPPWGNPILLVGTAAAFLLHLGALHFSLTQEVLRVEPLDLVTWLEITAVSLSVIVVNEAHKRLRRPDNGA
jgi:magnesium-transporting ATPase (P-type)